MPVADFNYGKSILGHVTQGTTDFLNSKITDRFLHSTVSAQT